MQKKRPVTLIAMLVLAAVFVAGCGGPPPVAPEGCMPEISQEAALAAQEKAMAGLLTGSIELTSSEWGSLAIGLVNANMPNLPIEELSYCFSPDASYAKVVTTDGWLLEAVGDTYVVDNRFVVDLQALAVDGQAMTEPMLDIIVDAANRALDDPRLAVAGSIEYGEDVVTISLGQ